jgi:hypothetical protein
MVDAGHPPHQVVSLTTDQVEVLRHAVTFWQREVRSTIDTTGHLMNAHGPRRTDRRQYLWHEAATTEHLMMLLARCSGVTIDGGRLKS